MEEEVERSPGKERRWRNESCARGSRKVEEKWREREREEKQRDNDDGIKSNYIGAASSINHLYIQFSGGTGYCKRCNFLHNPILYYVCGNNFQGFYTILHLKKIT